MSNIIDGYGSQFFPDQEVNAADLNNIQYASIHTLRNFLSVITKSPGVFIDTTADTGLLVTCNSDGSRLEVSSGVAIDSQGQIIYIPNNPTTVIGSIGLDPLYYPARPSRVDIDPEVSSAGTYYINIQYSSIFGSSKFDDAGISNNTRVYDSYTISVDSTRATDGLTLATAQFDASGSISVTTDTSGFVSSISGTRFALFDDRSGYTMYNFQIGANSTNITELQDAVFEEELEKSIGFLFPADGHSMVTKINRDATLVRMELYMELLDNSTGTVSFSLFSGSTANEWKFGPETLQTSTADVYATKDLSGLRYYAHNPIKFSLDTADDTVTRVTATLVYKRLR